MKIFIVSFVLLITLFSNSFISSNANEVNTSQNDIKIISRKEWEAKDPIKEMFIHKPEKITIHHSGVIYPVKVNLIEKMKGLQRYSQSSEKMANGKVKEVWADVPYHFIISGTGEIAEGRNINYSGDTNTEYDPKNHILINVLGNFQDQEPTEEQIKSIVKLCSYLCKKYNISIEEIKGHNDFATTDCLGKNLSKLINDIKKQIEL